MLRKWGMFVLMLLAAPALVFAQNTGKISGVVNDGDTGDPLPGASVALAGTTMGTITDVDGNYFIIGVPVGTYDVQASFVGYQTETVAGVIVSSGYTQELNFTLSAGVELDEIIVEYERPLIQKDAIGVPKIVTAEEIVNLPVRGTADVAKIQAGVVSQEGSDDLNIRGGRDSEVTYYIDGVKVFGTAGIPQSAVQEQEMLIGSISARYGDAMSGIINITTKSGSSKFFGSFEGITSESLDDFGYNLISGAIGGPVGGPGVNFFLSAEYLDQTDRNPRAVGELRINDDVMADLWESPTGFDVTSADGVAGTIKIPATLADGAYVMMDSDGDVITDDGFLTFSDGTKIAIAEGSTVDTFRPYARSERLTSSQYAVSDAKRKTAQTNLALSGNLKFNVLDNANIRIGGRLNTGEWDESPGNRRSVFAYDQSGIVTRDDYQMYGTWTHYLSNSTFYQLQFDFSDRKTEEYDTRFGNDFDNLLSLSDVDGADAFSTLRGYKNMSLEDMDILDADGNPHTVSVPTFNNVYSDGRGPATSDDVVYTLVQVPGGRFNNYNQVHNQQFRFTASATTQVGLHQLEFGGEYETRTQRSWSMGSGLSRFVNDTSGPEQIANDDPDHNPDGYSTYDSMPGFVIDDFGGGYGFDLRGQNEIDTEDFAAFLDKDINKPESSYNRAPYEPIYYGGYIQDKIEFRDIILNLGLRVDVFDNNIRVLKDRFARRNIQRAGSLGIALPVNVGPDDAVYFSGDDVIGYRRNNTNDFFNLNGDPTQGGEIILNGAPNQLDAQIVESQFADYDPAVTVMPRIGVSFPVTDQALFFASYGVVAQRPSGRNFATLASFEGTGGMSNTNLQPEKTTSYELGFRQRLGTRAAFTISGFFRQIENLIQIREIRGSSPSVYSSYENVDFGTVKGVEFGFDLRRTNNLSANVNYTLSFADGTGSGDRTTSTIVWVDETPPNFISPLTFDQRHKMNISLDYRMGEGEGPTIFGGKLLQNTGLNVLVTAGSGFPYTAVVEPFSLAGGARAASPRGEVNGDRFSGQSRVDLRLDRRFTVGGAQMSAFIWVQNLFDQQNQNNGWRFTGLADQDGFLATPSGRFYLSDKPQFAEDLYDHRSRRLPWVGIPRLTRIGVRVDF